MTRTIKEMPDQSCIVLISPSDIADTKEFYKPRELDKSCDKQAYADYDHQYCDDGINPSFVHN